MNIVVEKSETIINRCHTIHFLQQLVLQTSLKLGCSSLPGAEDRFAFIEEYQSLACHAGLQSRGSNELPTDCEVPMS